MSDLDPIARAGREARTVEINKQPTPVSDSVTWSVQGKAGEVLPRLAELIFSA